MLFFYRQLRKLSSVTSRNKLLLYGEELLPPRPISKLKEHRLSVIRGHLFNI